MAKIEILCDTCTHAEVCSFKKEYMSVVGSISRASVSLSKDRYIEFTNVSWLDDMVLPCKYYKKNKPSTISYRNLQNQN